MRKSEAKGAPSPSGRVRITSSSPSEWERFAVVFADPIRLKIVTELFRREMSPTGFSAAYGGGSPQRINSIFKRLAKFEWLRFVEARPRRGGEEHFYRAPKLAIIGDDLWEQLPAPLRAEFSWRTFEQFSDRVKSALRAGTFDARPE